MTPFKKKISAVTLSVNTVEGATEDLELTFPKTGGIRLSGANKGIHEAEENYDITCQTAGDVTTFTADNGEYVKLIQETDDWSIDLYNASNERVKSIKGSQIVFFYNDNAEIIKTKITGDVSENEKFTGLGERFNGLVQNGGIITLWNEDCLKSNFSVNSDKTASYINIPLLNSTEGYSIFLNSTYKTVADIAATDENVYTLTTNGNIFDVYCFVGETNDNINSYTNLTGKSSLPPKWAFSYMAGNHAKVWNKNGDPVAYLQNVMEKYNDLGTIPSAVYGEYGPEYKEESYNILSQYGSRMIGWQDSGMYLNAIDKYMDGIDGEYPLIKSLNSNKTYMSGGSSGDAYIDFTNPLGKLLFKNRILARVNMGWKGGMIDFGDDVLANSISSNGMKGDQMHNLYAYYYTKGVSEVLSESLGDDYFAFSRTGTAGSQKYMGVFTGDHPSTFQGLKQSLYAGLSLSSSGYSIWGSDLGGHGKQGDTNNADLYRRWLQFSTFSPLMRAHGLTDRNPWSYEETSYLIFKTNMNEEFKKYYWLRENFVDAIYSSAIKSSIDGTAMTQPLLNAFQNQAELYAVEDEYMFCNELLV
ncbi:MAG: glycoside hydrolase family 31 protein, partial [Clostridia bacterium]|nr:glycoside hydrolase family 31 protein [Clostridia bacterium]